MAVKKPREPKYDPVLRRIFGDHWTEGATEVPFQRAALLAAAEALGIAISNIGDVLYSYRYRKAMPDEIALRAPEGMSWAIRGRGDGSYAFVAIPAEQGIRPNPLLAVTRIPDATPGIIAGNALSDEQALLARLRYNRLLDIFTGVTCYSLQSHLRTKVPGIGQVETDEIYVGLDRHGTQYVLPVQAKGGRDRMNIVQIEQDLALCRAKFPALVCLAVGAQFMAHEQIALFTFRDTEDGVRQTNERHYQLVPHDQITPDDLTRCRQASETDPGQ